MELAEAIGYLAAALVFTTFCMKTMMPLRYLAISSNVAFILYGLLGQLYPVLILHSIMLPLNLYRLYEIKKLIRNVREAAQGDLNVDWLLPYMSKSRYEAGQVLFEKGEPAHVMFYIVKGEVRLKELDVNLGPGHLFGEMGLFAPKQARMNTAECATDVELLSITDRKVMELFYQNREFGFFLVRLITARLISNLDREATAA